MDRSIFGQLVPRQIMIYLFLCKAHSVQLKESWNSYNDIAAKTGMKRETVIETVEELEQLKYIIRSKRKSKENRRVYVDNHYFLITYVKGKIHKKSKKIARLYCEYNRTGLMPYKGTYYINFYPNTEKRFCQEVSENFFTNRGSP